MYIDSKKKTSERLVGPTVLLDSSPLSFHFSLSFVISSMYFSSKILPYQIILYYFICPMETNYDDIELFSFINLWIYHKNLKCNEKCKRKQQQT